MFLQCRHFDFVNFVPSKNISFPCSRFVHPTPQALDVRDCIVYELELEPPAFYYLYDMMSTGIAGFGALGRDLAFVKGSLLSPNVELGCTSYAFNHFKIKELCNGNI